MKKKLKFIQEAKYNDEVVHQKDEIVELDDSKGYATRWIKRGIAVEITENLKSAKSNDNKNQDKKPDSNPPVNAAATKNPADALAKGDAQKDNKSENDL